MFCCVGIVLLSLAATLLQRHLGRNCELLGLLPSLMRATTTFKCSARHVLYIYIYGSNVSAYAIKASLVFHMRVYYNLATTMCGTAISSAF